MKTSGFRESCALVIASLRSRRLFFHSLLTVGFLLPVASALLADCTAGRATAAAEGMEPVRVTADGHGFVLAESGTPFTPWGCNYLGEFGTILEEYWADDWEAIADDFRAMRGLGANVVRVHLQLPAFMESPERMRPESLDRLRRLLDLARDHGLRVDVTGLCLYRIKDVPAWLDALDEEGRWRAQEFFWREIARACRDHPAVFCLDLMNEPVVTEPGEGEPAWLTGELEGFHFVQRIAREMRGRTQAEVAAAWVARMTAAIRAVDPRVLVTVGVIPWSQIWPGATPVFYTPEAARHLDFVSVHLYPRAGRIDADLAVLADYAIGKPIVIEETFPLHCSQEEFDEFLRRSRGVAAGWIGHYFGRTIAEHRATAGDRDAAIAAFLESWRHNAP
jgi:hypothetical protein